MTREQELLIEKYHKLPQYLARSWAKTQNLIDVDELESIANLALCRAADKYDPSRGVSFQWFCGKCIDNAIKSELTKLNKTAGNICYEEYQESIAGATVTTDIQKLPLKALRDAREKLTDIQREMLTDHYELGMPQREMATKYGRSQKYIFSSLRKAREDLALLMGPQEYDE